MVDLVALQANGTAGGLSALDTGARGRWSTVIGVSRPPWDWRLLLSATRKTITAPWREVALREGG